MVDLDAIHMLNNNILQLTVLKYTFTGGVGGWVGGAGLSGNKANLSPAELI